MPMPRDYTIILSELIENETLDMREVLESLLNWLSEEEVYSFCQEEYELPVNVAYRKKYDIGGDVNED
tara:strand:- start:285 stop:488 length:204 start_codon:yes stop_codon:yes gene_type:complete